MTLRETRFTSQDFTTTAVMLDNGNPASIKSIRGWVEGSLIETIETDEITNVSPDGLTLTFSGDKDLAKLQPGDSIIQNERTPLQTPLNTKDLTIYDRPCGKLTISPIEARQNLSTTMSTHW